MSQIIQFKSGTTNVYPRAVAVSWTYDSSVSIETRIQNAVANGTLPLEETFLLRTVYGSYYWGIGAFYKTSENNLYGSGIFGTFNRIWKMTCNNGTWTSTNL